MTSPGHKLLSLTLLSILGPNWVSGFFQVPATTTTDVIGFRKRPHHAKAPFPWDQTEMGGLFPSGAMLDPIWKVRNWEVRGTRGALHVRVSGLEHLGPGTLPEAWTE